MAAKALNMFCLPVCIQLDTVGRHVNNIDNKIGGWMDLEFNEGIEGSSLYTKMANIAKAGWYIVRGHWP